MAAKVLEFRDPTGVSTVVKDLQEASDSGELEALAVICQFKDGSWSWTYTIGLQTIKACGRLMMLIRRLQDEYLRVCDDLE